MDIALVNDSWYGFIDAWIYQNQVTWMEKTCASPFWTGLLLFSINSRRVRGKHGATRQVVSRKRSLLDPMYAHEGRAAFKGQLFRAPMDWQGWVQQLQRMEGEAVLESLPILGAVLTARVLLLVSAVYANFHHSCAWSLCDQNP